MEPATTKKPPIKLLLMAAVGLVSIISIFSIFGYFNNLHNQRVDRETRLSRQYETLKTGLDSYLVSARESAGITKAQSEAFDKIMLDAVSGRYQGKEGGPTSAQPGSGTLFSAIVEQYPNLDGINKSYDRILNIVSDGRTAFANNQAKLQDQLREYDQWRKSNLIRSFWLRTVIGVPSDDLAVNNGDQHLRGKEAYDKMATVITSGVTSDAFKSGTLEAQDFFDNEKKEQ